MPTPCFVIGIDTGGTYTDAVVLDQGSGRVLTSAKVPTTAHNPALAIGLALEEVLRDSSVEPGAISLVCVSTTLATNALVENKGAEVGLFVIGHDKRMDVPATELRYIPGGHKAKGVEAEPLGMEFLLQGILEMRPKVDAYAICSLLAVDDPTHELVAAKAVQLMDRTKPVFCSHQASSRPGMQERATTAILNARLLPVMQDFLRSIGASMQALGLSCPVRIVRGDCQAMDLEQALLHSSATVASGPAATALFGSHAEPGQTVLVVDVGGTTTDITLIRDGGPVIREEGMTIGAWRTHVQAVEMYTVGLGGDSLVRLQDGRIVLGPDRVVPLCQAHLYAQGAVLGTLTDPAAWIGPDLLAQCVFPLLDAPATGSGDPLLDWLARHGPATPKQLREELGMAEASLEKAVARLSSRRQVSACGFTPTDALHVLGTLGLGREEPARRGAEALALLLGLGVREFCRLVLDNARDTLTSAILCALGTREVGPALARFLNQDEPSPLLDISVRLRPRMVGIGAAAPFLLPEVARKLGTVVTFPDHYQVGNAVGAAIMRPNTENR